jgi:hypothetical protein
MKHSWLALVACAPFLCLTAEGRTTRSIPNQCEYELPDWYTVGVATWSGQCVDGKAEGKGVASGGGTLRLSGEFHEGKVVSADGVFESVKPNYEHEFLRVTGKDGQWSTAPLFDLPGKVAMPGWILGQWKVKYSNDRCDDIQLFEAPDQTVEVRSGTSALIYHVGFYKVESHPGWRHMLRVSGRSFDMGQNCKKQRGESQVLESAYVLRQGKGWRYCTEPAEDACVGTAKWLPMPEDDPDPSKPNPFEDHKKAVLDGLYRNALAAHPGIEGRIVFAVNTVSSGAVSECTVVASDFSDVPELERQLCDSVRTIRYPGFPGGTASGFGFYETAEFQP